MARRLLLLITDLLIGGTPTVVRELAIRLHREGVDVQVACLAQWGPTADEISSAGVKVTALGAREARDLQVILRLARLIRDERIDVVLSFLVHANVAASVARMGACFELYQSIQTTQPRPRWHWLAQRVVAAAAQRIVVPSASVANVAVQWADIPPGKLVVIPNAVEVPADFARREKESQRFRVTFLGRLDPVKRIPDLLEAIRLLGEGFELAIHGTGQEEALIRKRISSLGVADRVRLLPPSAGPWGPLTETDVLVLPSEAEGFGLVLIEAMAASVPVVATDVPGIRDVVQDGVNGLLVPAGNPSALADAIARLALDEPLRGSLVAAGRQTVRERYSWDPVIARYRHVLGV